MKLFYLLGALCLMSCVDKPNNLSVDKNVNHTNNVLNVDTLSDPSVDESELQYADYYLVIVDKSKSYDDLRNLLFNIHEQYNIEIDTLGRYFNKDKQQIILPENDEDEIYRGEYFPRRFESRTLSIEYAYIYQENMLEPTEYPTEMILVSGMFAEKQKADSLQNVLKSNYKNVFVQKTKVYIGCMH